MNLDDSAPVRQVEIAPLTGGRFAPFGDLVEHTDRQQRRYLSVPFEHDAGARADASVS
jgi:hypothetical protein